MAVALAALAQGFGAMTAVGGVQVAVLFETSQISEVLTAH